jgi:hypothetical protein
MKSEFGSKGRGLAESRKVKGHDFKSCQKAK